MTSVIAKHHMVHHHTPACLDDEGRCRKQARSSEIVIGTATWA